MDKTESLWSMINSGKISLQDYYQSTSNFLHPSNKSSFPLAYLSLFTGIGGFEIAIHNEFVAPNCVRFCENAPFKEAIYKKHFPNHVNLGDITKVSNQEWSTIKSNLVCAGFTCTSKSSLSVTRPQSRRQEDKSFDHFQETIRALKMSKWNDFILENVTTTGKSEISTDDILNTLKEQFGSNVWATTLDGCDFTGARRRRVFFTSFPITLPQPKLNKRFEFMLDPFSEVIEREKYNENRSDERMIPKNYANPYEYRTQITEFLGIREKPTSPNRWTFTSDTNKNCTATFTKRGDTYPNGIIIDRRGGFPLPRYITKNEMERLMGFPEGWTDGFSLKKSFAGLGDSVVIPAVQYIIRNLKIHRNY